MKSIFRAGFLTAVLLLSVSSAFAMSEQAKVSIGANYGFASTNLRCDGCPSLEEATANPYNLEIRGFVPISSGLEVGVELAVENSPSTDIRINGRNIATTSGYAISVMPMLRTNVIGNLKAFAGIGVASVQMEINANGRSWQDTANSILTAKAGLEYPLNEHLSAHVQWVHIDDRHSIGGTTTFGPRDEGQLGLAYNF